jgi:hypothetical protein
MPDDKTEKWFKKWRDAANILGKDPTAKVKCPECNNGHLLVKDVIIEKWNKLDRYMQYDSCSLYNVLTMEIPENYHRNETQD